MRTTEATRPLSAERDAAAARQRRQRATRVVVALASIAVIAAVNLVAALAGTADARAPLLAVGLIATVVAIGAATAEPGAFVWAFAASLPGVFALFADGAPRWLIGPLAVGLLVAAELNAYRDELRSRAPTAELAGARVARLGALAALGLASSLAVLVAPRLPAPGGTGAVLVAAVALAAIAGLALVHHPNR